MKKILALILALCMVFALCACGNEKTPDPTKTPDATETPATTEPTAAPAETEEPDVAVAIETVTPGVLTVATSPDFAPYEFYALDEEGTPTLAGFDMDLAKYIADYLGLELEVIPMDFDGTIMELAAGKVDLGMAGYSPAPDRADKMDFSTVYITGGQSFVCLQSNKDQFTSLEDTNKADYTIGAQVGSIQADLAKENSADADIIELAKVTDIIAELLTGKMDGAYIETMVAEAYAKNYPELCVVLDVPYDAEGSVVGVNKGNTALLEGVNAAIEACQSSGEFDSYVVKAIEQAQGDIIEGLIEG